MLANISAVFTVDLFIERLVVQTRSTEGAEGEKVEGRGDSG